MVPSRWPTACRSTTCRSSCARRAHRRRFGAAHRGPRHPRGVHRDPLPGRPPRRDARPCSACARSRSLDTEDEFDVGRADALAASSASCGARADASDDDDETRRPSRSPLPLEVQHRHLGGDLAAARRLARRSADDGCRDARRPSRGRASTRSPTAIPDGHGRAARARVRSEVWGRPIAGLEHVPDGCRVRGSQPRLPRRRRGAPLRDRPVDAPHDAARPRARAPRPGRLKA